MKKFRLKRIVRKTGSVVILAALFLSGCSQTTEASEKAETAGATAAGDSTDAVGAFADYTVETVPDYSGETYVMLENNVPDFEEEDLTTEVFEEYSALDSEGRCGVAYANICQELMPTEERGAIGMVKPSGWHTVKYSGIVEGNYLYNRCHLIGYQLAGENANTKNLITGTRWLNTEGMLPFEDAVADYVHTTGNHVLYRVTPVFEGNDLVASGVQMEAESVEDAGAAIEFNVYIYNVQPGVEIDYTDGGSQEAADPAEEIAAAETEAVRMGEHGTEVYALSNGGSYSGSEAGQSSSDTGSGSDSQALQGTDSSAESTDSNAQTYILNTNTKKFHLPGCKSVAQMAEHNKKEVTETRDQLLAEGYSPCGNCNP